MSRVLAWFSCGDASAVAAKLAIEKYGKRVEVCYCNTLAYEHPDNLRFMEDISQWLGQKIKILSSAEYKDIFDVFRKTRFLVSPDGARCTNELKKKVRFEYQEPGDLHIFGLTSDEGHRIKRFKTNNLGTYMEFPLLDAKITKAKCHEIIRQAGIELPAMYRLGYQNNNCIGCVKGGMGYWNKIRVDFPDAFARMAAMERELGIAILTIRKKGEERRPIFLDELPPHLGRYSRERAVECGVGCQTRDLFA